MFRIAILFVFAGLFTACAAPTDQSELTQSISGVVIDAETGQPVPYATVETDPVSESVHTDDNGYYAIANLEVMTYTILVRAEGYEITRTPVQVVAANSARADLALVRHVESTTTIDSTQAPYYPITEHASSPQTTIPSNTLFPPTSSTSSLPSPSWKSLSNVTGSASLTEVSAIAGGHAWITSETSLWTCAENTCSAAANLPENIQRIVGVRLLSPDAGLVLGLDRAGSSGALVLGIWNGSQWYTSSISPFVSSCHTGRTLEARSLSDIWASCGTKAWHWNGSTWQSFDMPDYIYRIRIAPNGRTFALLHNIHLCEFTSGAWDCDIGGGDVYSESINCWWDFSVNDQGTRFLAVSEYRSYAGTADSMAIVTYRGSNGSELYVGGNAVDWKGNLSMVADSYGIPYQGQGATGWNYTSPVGSKNMKSLTIVTTTEAWAVGSSGVIQRWY